MAQNLKIDSENLEKLTEAYKNRKPITIDTTVQITIPEDPIEILSLTTSDLSKFGYDIIKAAQREGLPILKGIINDSDFVNVSLDYNPQPGESDDNRSIHIPDELSQQISNHFSGLDVRNQAKKHGGNQILVVQEFLKYRLDRAIAKHLEPSKESLIVCKLKDEHILYVGIPIKNYKA